jgi:hypothetical protein
MIQFLQKHDTYTAPPLNDTVNTLTVLKDDSVEVYNTYNDINKSYGTRLVHQQQKFPYP